MNANQNYTMGKMKNQNYTEYSVRKSTPLTCRECIKIRQTLAVQNQLVQINRVKIQETELVIQPTRLTLWCTCYNRIITLNLTKELKRYYFNQ